jgi:hypothetical protein
VTAIKRWTVLLHVERDRDALWLAAALENSDSMALAWLAKDCEEALLYLQGDDVYANRTKYPEPNVVIVSSSRHDAAKMFQATHDLPNPPLIVHLTPEHNISETLCSMRTGAACCQPRPANLGETIAFVDWLEGWLPSVGSLDTPSNDILAFPGKGPQRQVADALLSALG